MGCIAGDVYKSGLARTLFGPSPYHVPKTGLFWEHGTKQTRLT